LLKYSKHKTNMMIQQTVIITPSDAIINYKLGEHKDGYTDWKIVSVTPQRASNGLCFVLERTKLD